MEEPIDGRVAIIAAHRLRDDPGWDDEAILIRDGFRDQSPYIGVAARPCKQRACI